MIKVVEPVTVTQLNEVRRLMRAFVEWARERYSAQVQFVDRYFDGSAFAAELIGLPGKYSRPKGRLLLALDDENAVGCVAFRELEAGICEMKRLYVDTGLQGKGIGRLLVSSLIREAQSAGYSKMRLDTGPNQIEAERLYLSAGFRIIQPYYELPEELRGWLLFMEMDLEYHE